LIILHALENRKELARSRVGVEPGAFEGEEEFVRRFQRRFFAEAANVVRHDGDSQ
jgi:hypothetical protein